MICIKVYAMGKVFSLMIFIVIVISHTYPHKPLRKMRVAIYMYQADSSLTCCLMSDTIMLMVISKHGKEHGHT